IEKVRAVGWCPPEPVTSQDIRKSEWRTGVGRRVAKGFVQIECQSGESAFPEREKGSMGTLTETLPQDSTVASAVANTTNVVRERTFSIVQLITAMLKSGAHISDLIFSPGRAPQVEISGQLVELKFKGLEMLTHHDTKFIANELMAGNEIPMQKLEKEGSADLSYAINGVGRFRVNIFRQRGTNAIVMRVIPDKIPGFDDLKLPKVLEEIVELRNGVVLVTGPTGSGKSSTLAAILDKMNSEKPYHILTIED